MLSRVQSLIVGKKCLEIGGPSGVFKDGDVLPIYNLVGSLDGINFSTKTIWENQITEGPNQYHFYPWKSPGYQYIGESTQLPIPDETYDFVISSHCLEHTANPIKALFETRRVLKPGGYCIFILPKKEGTFDHRRGVTLISHLIDDYSKNVGEDDLTHLNEILELHDLSLDSAAGTSEQFKERSLKNSENRCLHQHVFDQISLKKCLEYVGFNVLEIEIQPPYHIIILGQKI